jgi:hypothetical protein
MVDGIGYLVFGWALHLQHLARTVEPDWPRTWTALGCLAALTVGVQLFGRRGCPGAWRWGWSFASVGVVVLGFLAGIALLGMTQQFAWLATSKEPLYSHLPGDPAWMKSEDNLRQLGRGVHLHNDFDRGFPPGGTFDDHGRAMHGWQTLILPYMDEEDLYRRIDLSRPWNDPKNLPALQTVIDGYLNPTIEVTLPPGPAPSHYAANVHVLNARPIKFTDFTDGTSNTLLAGEAAAEYKPWGHPTNWRDPTLGLNTSPDGFGHPRGNVVMFVFADGFVRSIRADVGPEVLKALSTPAGGESVKWDY